MSLTRFQDTEEINKDLDELAQALERLRIMYEQYFLGLEKQPPIKIREKVDKLIRKYAGMAMQNIRSRFRYQQTVARYNSFKTYWDRVLRQIEEGTCERDVFRAGIHEKMRKEKEESKPVAAKKRTSAKADPYGSLFTHYVSMRKKNDESIKGLNYNTFKKTLLGQIDMIKKKTGAKSVRFQIITEKGKTKIKAIPRTQKASK